MLSRSNSLLYLGRVQKYRDLNNLAINFGPLAQIISTMPWIMSSKPLSSPGSMKGQFCKTSNFYQAAMHLWNCQRQEIIQSISTAAVSTCYSVLNRRDKRLHLSSFLTLFSLTKNRILSTKYQPTFSLFCLLYSEISRWFTWNLIAECNPFSYENCYPFPSD